MQLKTLLDALGGDHSEVSAYDIDISSLTCDSRLVSAGSLFVAIDGVKEKGSGFINEAIKRGAACIVAAKDYVVSGAKQIPVIKVSDTRAALAALGDKFFDHPSGKIKVVGVTGTNGKTTITYLINNILKEAGFSSGIIGTIGYHINDKVMLLPNTTPGALELQSFLKEMVDNKCDYCIMEVSSHGLDQKRAANIDFKAAIFTNLTHDHLDYHGSMENYFLAKAGLFRNLDKDAYAIVNLDSPYALRLKSLCRGRLFTYSIDTASDLMPEDLSLGLDGSSFTLKAKKTEIKIKTSLIGKHNVSNILSGVAFALTQGLELPEIKKGVESFKGAKGRLEKVINSKGINIFIDYAHTPDALENVLGLLRRFSKSGLAVVFGCGGDRDRAKRPAMGKIAGIYADRIIITSDNPRSEPPEEIANEIAAGLGAKNYRIILDRKEAIICALKEARAGDIVLIAGKGHENYQIFKDRKIEFDDGQVVEEWITLP